AAPQHREVAECRSAALPRAVLFPQEHARDAVGEVVHAAGDGEAFREPPRQPVERLVGEIFGCLAAFPREQIDELSPERFVPAARLVAIRSERVEEAIERFAAERPAGAPAGGLARRRGHRGPALSHPSPCDRPRDVWPGFVTVDRRGIVTMRTLTK